MAHTFHLGEIAVQRRAAVEDLAQPLARSILDYMPPVAQRFAAGQRMAMVGFTDVDGRVWVSRLTGDPGFIHPRSATELWIDVPQAHEEEIWGSRVHSESWPCGLILVDFTQRRRMRVNGDASWHPEGIELRVREAFSNCGRNVRADPLVEHGEALQTAHPVEWDVRLSAGMQMLIRQAPRYFIATTHPDRGMDVSHKGGACGFVMVEDDLTLWLPDYAGNHLFNTLGNLHVDPRVGLLFWNRCTLLQISGVGEMKWLSGPDPRFAHAERLVRVRVERSRLRIEPRSNFRPTGQDGEDSVDPHEQRQWEKHDRRDDDGSTNH